MTYSAITYARKLAAEGKTAFEVFHGVHANYTPIKLVEAEEIVRQFQDYQAKVKSALRANV